MPTTNISQSRIITVLNQYLKWNNLPIRMDEEGVCNGLASVYAKYALEKRLPEFFSMMRYISGKKIEPYMASAVNHFAVEIITSFDPSKYNPNVGAMHSSEQLTINKKPLQAAFNFGTTTNKSNWVNIIKEINLKDDEAMRVVGANHAISISKKNGLYHIYDPNYSKGSKTCKNESDLINEIYNNNFHFIWGQLSMGISVIPHPDNPPREFPNITTLYAQYSKPTSSSFFKKPFSLFDLMSSDSSPVLTNIEYAAMWNNGEVVKHFLPFSQDKIIGAVYQAVFSNNISALEVLVPNITNQYDLKFIFLHALSRGQEKVVNEFLKNDSLRNYFNEELLSYGAIHMVASSGNLHLLQKIIEAYKHSEAGNANPNVISAAIVSEHAIVSAIDSNSAQCVRYLVDQLTEQDQLSEEQILLYLEHSIRKNSDELTAYFLKKLSPEAIKKLDMRQLDLRTIESTNLSILQQLKKAGAPFSELSNAIIAEKEHHPIGFFTSFRIELGKFSEFVKSELFPREKNEAIKSANQFRKQLKQSISHQDEDYSGPKL